ncbi:hypothetical protein QUW15_06475 [Desulfovibrio piger]|nr:hypothetical protein [Desulfovibrio piger]
MQRGNSNKLYEYHILLMLYFDALRGKRKQGEKPGGAVPPPRVSSFSKLKRSNYRPRHQIKKAGSANASCSAHYGKEKILFRELNTLFPALRGRDVPPPVAAIEKGPQAFALRRRNTSQCNNILNKNKN